MHPTPGGSLARLVAVTWLLGAGLAAAQPTPTAKAAEETFIKGRELMTQKKYAQACEAFEQSQRLDPQYGTQYNLAGCYVELGKLATAWNLYRELSRSDKLEDRRAASANAATALAPRVPKLLLQFDARPADAKVTMNNLDAGALVGVETPVDFGSYAFVVIAEGFETWQRTVDVKAEGKVVRVVVKLYRPGETPAPEPKPDPIVGVDPKPDLPAPIPDPPEQSKKGLYGKIVLASGAGLVAMGLGFGAVALVKWGDAKSNTTDPVDQVNLQVDSARLYGNLSTGFVAVGLVAAAAGVYLWQTAPSGPTVTASIGASSAGLVVAGQF